MILAYNLSFLAGDDNQQKKKKLGTCLTEALKLVMLIGILLCKLQFKHPNVYNSDPH